jgi:hypothetical protein
VASPISRDLAIVAAGALIFNGRAARWSRCLGPGQPVEPARFPRRRARARNKADPPKVDQRSREKGSGTSESWPTPPDDDEELELELEDELEEEELEDEPELELEEAGSSAMETPGVCETS